jgi:hypothetical protein
MDERATSPIGQAEWSADPLERLSELRGARQLIDRMLIEAVRECRRSGKSPTIEQVGGETRRGEAAAVVTWSQIGKALGISEQAARNRFQHHLTSLRLSPSV